MSPSACGICELEPVTGSRVGLYRPAAMHGWMSVLGPFPGPDEPVPPSTLICARCSPRLQAMFDAMRKMVRPPKPPPAT